MSAVIDALRGAVGSFSTTKVRCPCCEVNVSEYEWVGVRFGDDIRQKCPYCGQYNENITQSVQNRIGNKRGTK